MKNKMGLKVKTHIKAGAINDDNNGKGKGVGSCPPGSVNNGQGCASIADL